MLSKPTRALVDLAALVGIVWLWVAIDESFTHSGLWLTVDGVLGGAATFAGQAAELVICVLIGWLSVATASYVLWCVLLRGRLGGDFPEARLRPPGAVGARSPAG